LADHERTLPPVESGFKFGWKRLTDAVSPDASLEFERARALPGGSVEIVYAVTGESGASEASEARDEGWAPSS
jgi:hypothetical protein